MVDEYEGHRYGEGEVEDSEGAQAATFSEKKNQLLHIVIDKSNNEDSEKDDQQAILTRQISQDNLFPQKKVDQYSEISPSDHRFFSDKVGNNK